MSPSEVIARRYADIFVQLFDSVRTDWRRPWIVPQVHPQQTMDGRAFEGTNRLLASLFATQRGFGIPVWMTFNRAREIGVSVNRGAKSLPVTHFSSWYVEKETHRRTDLTDEQYRALPPEDRERYERWTNLSWYSEFNIDQTDFAEVYPGQYRELQEHFGAYPARACTEAGIDRMVERGEWICRIEVGGADTPGYDPINYVIRMPEKSRFPDESRYYATLFREMSHSLGDEMFRDRNLLSCELSDYAQEQMIAELSSATLCSLVGLDATISDGNLAYLKTWASAIDRDPNIIYSVVREAAGTARDISERLGIEQRQGFDLSAVLARMEQAEGERRTAAPERKAAQGRRQDRNPVRTVPSGNPRRRGL